MPVNPRLEKHMVIKSVRTNDGMDPIFSLHKSLRKYSEKIRVSVIAVVRHAVITATAAIHPPTGPSNLVAIAPRTASGGQEGLIEAL